MSERDIQLYLIDIIDSCKAISEKNDRNKQGSREVIRFIIILLLIISFSACGRKGDPIPPKEEMGRRQMVYSFEGAKEHTP